MYSSDLNFTELSEDLVTLLQPYNIQKMKKLVLLSALSLLSATFITAQENKTIKEETTLKRVVKKEGDKVVTSETEAKSSEKGAVIVADDGQENQYFREDTKADQQTKTSDEFEVDSENRELVEARKKQQEEELRKSIEAAKAKAEAERKMLEAKEAERLQALEANRKKLEKRGKGVGKLKKKKGN